MRRSRVILLIALLLATAGAWYLYHRIDSFVRNAYAVEWVASMIVNHLETNAGRWPKNWDDLHDDYVMNQIRVGKPWTFEELRERVIVDWEADPKALGDQARQSPNGTTPFRVIRLTDGTTDHWQSTEPNKIVVDYFRKNGSGAH